jgi:Domain of unknown function (DUF1911)/Domain of unknown function (DUF1910)
MAKREPLMTDAYFNEAITDLHTSIEEREAKLASMPPALKKPHILARANFVGRLELLLTRYSAGEPVVDLVSAFEPIVAAWERTLSHEAASPNDLAYLDDYVRSLWLVSLGIIFDTPDDVWKRLLTCMGNEGRDQLVERLVARRTPGRPAATALLHPGVYAPLDKAATSLAAQEVARFLKGWYAGLRDVGWHDAHKGPDGGGFFGYWAVEAAGVVVAFGLDDAALRGLPSYPADLSAHGLSCNH